MKHEPDTLRRVNVPQNAAPTTIPHPRLVVLLFSQN